MSTYAVEMNYVFPYITDNFFVNFKIVDIEMVFPALGMMDLISPTITLISPENGSAISKSTPIVIDVTDDVSLQKIMIVATFGDVRELVYDGNFSKNYSVYSNVSSISNGYRFSLKRKFGWPYSPKIDIMAIDFGGNINE